MWLIPLVLGSIFFVPVEYFSWALVGVFLIAGKEWGRLLVELEGVYEHSVIGHERHVAQW